MGRVYGICRRFGCKVNKCSYINEYIIFFSSPELAQGELLGYCDVRRASDVWTSVASETSVRQFFSLCTL